MTVEDDRDSLEFSAELRRRARPPIPQEHEQPPEQPEPIDFGAGARPPAPVETGMNEILRSAWRSP